MTCLITGGTGTIGVLMAKRLAERGESVVAYDLTPSRAPIEAVMGPDALRRVTLVQGDVLDLPLLLRTARQHKVDRIAHLGVALAAVVNANPAMGQRVNVDGTTNVFEAALAVAARRVVFASSTSVFGPRSISPDGVIANDGPFDPRDIYGATKLLNERAAYFYARRYGLRVIGLRFPAVYGPVPRGSTVKWLPELIASLVNGEPARAPRANRAGAYVYVEDVARAIELALDTPKDSPLVVTLAGEHRRLNDIVDIVASHFPEARIERIDEPDMANPPRRFDPRPAKDLLGWEPEVQMEEGVRRIIDYHRSRKQH